MGRLRATGWLGWFLLIPLSDANAVILSVLGDLPWTIRLAGDGIFLLVPPAVAGIACVWLAYPVEARLSGTAWTRRRQLHYTGLSQLALILPGLLLLASLGALLDGQIRWALLLVLAAPLARLYGSTRCQLVARWEWRALTHGPLRDRVITLAEKAQVNLRQLYIIFSPLSHAANAFATPDEAIGLTETLVRNLSARELDTIVAHELAHLRQQRMRMDPRPASWWDVAATMVQPGCWLALLAYTCLAGAGYLDWQRWLPIVFVFLGGALRLFRSGHQRRHERDADRDAVQLTGDPEAYIRALVRLCDLNRQPLEARTSLVAEHPAVLRRIEDVATLGGVPQDRLQKLLAAPETPAEVYPLPAEVTSDDLIFSTRFKSILLASRWWVLLVVQIILPALAVAYIVPRAGDTRLRWALVLTSIAITALVLPAAMNLVTASSYRRARRRWETRQQPQGRMAETVRSWFVAYAPGSAPLLHEGHPAWDIGTLSVAGGRLVYSGERTSFSLPPNHVDRIEFGARDPDTWPSSRMHLSWHGVMPGTGGTFSVWLPDLFFWQNAAARAALARDLRAWQQHPIRCADLPADPVSVSLPDPAAVSGTSPIDVFHNRSLTAELMRDLYLAGIVTVLLGIRLEDPFPGGAGSVLLFVGVLTVARRIPYWFAWRQRQQPFLG